MSWKIGSREDNEHSVSSNLPVFHPSSKPKIYFLILLNTISNRSPYISKERVCSRAILLRLGHFSLYGVTANLKMKSYLLGMV